MIYVTRKVEPRAVSFIHGLKRAATATTLRGISYVPCSLAVTCYIGPRDAFGARCAKAAGALHRSNSRIAYGGNRFRERRPLKSSGPEKTKETWLRERLCLSGASLALSDLSRVSSVSFSLHVECASLRRESSARVREIDRLFRVDFLNLSECASVCTLRR